MPDCECPTEAGAETCDPTVGQEAKHCPSCGQRGKQVDLLTVKALLAVPLTEIRHSGYFFCRKAECRTVYFSADGEQSFSESALRERVYQKHPGDGDVFVCYCFRRSVAGVGSARADSGRPDVVEAITAGIRDGLCACEIRNPQGSCCLGNVRALLDSWAP